MPRGWADVTNPTAKVEAKVWGLASVVTRSFGSGVHAGALLGDSNSNPEASNDAIITPSTSSHTNNTGFGSSEKTKGCPLPN
jgi:hypothetical protein